MTKTLESKIDKLDERLDSIDKTLARQEVSLSEHIRRTELLENAMKPVQRHVAHIEGGLKLIGIISLVLTVIGTVVGIIAGIKGLF